MLSGRTRRGPHWHRWLAIKPAARLATWYGYLTQQCDCIMAIAENVNLIPGVKVEMRTIAAGNRIVIRGYGNQTNFNGVGYKAYLNDVPLTDADGTTFLDDVDFTTLSRKQLADQPLRGIAYDPRPLQDWPLPVVYEAAPIALFPRRRPSPPRPY